MRSTYLLVSLFGFGMLLFGATTARADVKLPAIVGDNMVVQRDAKVRIWGWAEPGEQVTVTMAGKSASAKTSADGRWEVMIGPYAAGGPHRMTIAGKKTVTLENVLVGEVWVGSGQSNMEWPLVNAKNGPDEVSRANYPEIRHFTVTKATSLDPREDVEGHWVVCSPDTAGSFSAVAYFFGRELNQTLKVPVGLIHTSWGGTPAEAWTRREALVADSQFQPMVKALASSLESLPTAQKEYEAAIVEWNRKNMLQDPGNKGFDLGYARDEFADADWQTAKMPQYFESTGLAIDGSVWYRKAFDVPAAWAGKDLALSLGPIDDFDTTYVNGTKVGGIGEETPNFWMVPRKYTVPGSLVRAGRNVIAVRVFDHTGNGGFGGSAGDLWLRPAAGGDMVSLAGDWRYKVETGAAPIMVDYSTQPVAPPGAGNPNSPTVLYNAMIAPLTPYTIRGAIWYQGEANADRGRQYQTLFPTMIRDWRKMWGEGDFPFYFVQLANWQPRKAEPAESHWAELREAQTMTLREPQTGMAVTIDIGETDDIHPRNKQDVGRRLALWALAKTYGTKTEFSGPLYASYGVESNKIRVRFSHAEGLRTKDGAPVEGFAIAGADGKFVWAKASVEKDSVVVWSDAVAEPKAVRYAWADNPVTNLYNGAGLPASPFRTDAPSR